MSGDGYAYPYPYHHPPPTTPSYPVTTPAQSWNWSLQQQQQYMQSYTRNPATYNTNTLTHNSHSTTNHSSHTNNHNNNFRTQGYHNSPTHTNRSYYRNRYNTGSNNQYSGNQQHGSNWQRNQNNYKRNRTDSSAENEPQLKTTKKKKKPLSQNVPNKKEWTIDEAEQALAVEKEHNKKSKNALIIKFPDQELNKEIVAQFHTSIENVHFQQPCTPRFCFVTLQETADPEEVISVLNQQKFGEGCLSVEYKKDREEDQAIGAEDIDPLTLYVGNLAQEITKDDMVTMYPNCRRIDIGFAKKMKFTRYAFVGFRNVTDSMEAFKNTHSKQMYNKSLIVRFRRLHGTVGMPGESKPQNPPKNKDELLDSIPPIPNTVVDKRISESPANNEATSLKPSIPDSISSSPEPVITLTSECDAYSDTTEILRIKQERASPNNCLDELNHTSMFDDCCQYIDHNPKEVKEAIKLEIKTENDKISRNVLTIKSEVTQDASFRVKDEPYDSIGDTDYPHEESDGGNDIDDDVAAAANFGTDFNHHYAVMQSHRNAVDTLKKAGTENSIA